MLVTFYKLSDDEIMKMQESIELLMISDDYIHKIYGGVLGKIVGVRLGIPFENQTASEIQRKFPHITGYVTESEVMNPIDEVLNSIENNQEELIHPDDDTNGFVFFIKIFQKIHSISELTPEIVAHTILNVAAANRGFFWWADDFAECQSFHNLLNGVSPLECGDEAHIGKACNHVGGQIFYDAIGLIFAGKPKDAAYCAGIVSSVLHHGEGALGGQFICACISVAFQESDISKIIETGLAVIPPESNYAKAVKDIINFYKENPYDWKACLCYIEEHYYTNMIWDYTTVIILSLLYGNGNFSRSMEICIHCGGDTDCNCGNLGTILGVLGGYDKIFYPKWVAPMNDVLYCSSTLPGENEVSITQLTAQIVELYCKFNGCACPKYIVEAEQLSHYSFAFPYSYQNVQAHMYRNNEWRPDLVNRMKSLWVTSGEVTTPSGSPYSLKFWAEQVQPKDYYRICRWFSHDITEFNSLKYEPTLCPRLYPGQIVSINIMTLDNTCDMRVCLMAYSSETKKELRSDYQKLTEGDWKRLEIKLPSGNFFYNCINIEIIPEKQSKLKSQFDGLSIYLDDFKVEGIPHYTQENAFQLIEYTHYPFIKDFTICYNTKKHVLGSWYECNHISCNHKELTMMFTGLTDMCNYTASCDFTYRAGNTFLMNIAVQGVLDHYAVGFYKNNKISILKSSSIPGDYIELCSKKFNFEKCGVANNGIVYTYKVELYDNQITFSVSKCFTCYEPVTETLVYHASDSLVGCIGFTSLGENSISILKYEIKPNNEHTDVNPII